MTFEEYAELARLLAERRGAGAQSVAAAERRRDLHAAADFLDGRLTAQGRRLDLLGRAVGEPPAAAPAAEPGTAPAGPSTLVGDPPAVVAPDPDPGETAAAPARPVVEACDGAASASVPGVSQRDPVVELELARRYADEADRHGQQAELLARRPMLLPAWSPVARATAVYLGSAGAGVVLMFAMVLASGLGALGAGPLYAWMCAGLPAGSLISGWLVLGRWGRAPMEETGAARHPVLGVAVCFLLVPLAYCGYLLLLRIVR
ncbi:hypothetical protein [Micromonospora musae]|uniref:hypothetical protein n=1 Tax=Micromonospora musae TaxID=1894970 RepID=UPI003439D589